MLTNIYVSDDECPCASLLRKHLADNVNYLNASRVLDKCSQIIASYVFHDFLFFWKNYKYNYKLFEGSSIFFQI